MRNWNCFDISNVTRAITLTPTMWMGTIKTRLCNAVLDITGDAREEIVVWDPSEMWVFTQSDSPLQQLEFESEKNPLYNYSNYQTTVSIPR